MHLYKEEVWLPVAVLRTNVNTNVVGQISHDFRRLLHIFFLRPFHFADAGVTIVVDRPRLLRATFGNVVADGDANRAIWPFLGVQHCLVARSLRYLGATYSVNDVLCFGNGMFGEVKACCEADDAHVLLVKKMECIEKVSNSSSLCSVGSLAAVNLKDYPIYTAYEWTTVDRGILVLHTSLM